MTQVDREMGDEESRTPASDPSLPNQIIDLQECENSEKKDREAVVIDGDEVFHFTGRTGFFEEEKSIFQMSGRLKLCQAVPILPKRVAVACLLLNFIFPGLGTAVGAFASLVCPCEEHMAKRWIEVFIFNILAAICQLLTIVYFFIGYFWGIWWGIQMIQKSPVRGQQKIYSINVLEKRRHSYDNKATKSQKSKM